MIAGAANRHRLKIHFIKDYLEVKSYLQKNACQASVFPRPGSGINRAGESARTYSMITKLLKNQMQVTLYSGLITGS